MTHPNFMVAWDEIACKRGHETHDTITVDVHLGGPTPYHDYPPIPMDLETSFTMEVWDPQKYPVDGGPYCPAHDAVSATIVSHGVWEPRETTLALRTFKDAPEDSFFVDIGAQIGWFTLLAAVSGVDVTAIECDVDNARLLLDNFVRTAAPFNVGMSVIQDRVGPDTELLEVLEGQRICLAKIDLEGAERDAVRVLWPAIEAGLVDNMLIEISPCFDDYYGDLVVDLMDYFDVFRLPPKSVPAFQIDGTAASLQRWSLGREKMLVHNLVNSWHQEDLWFARKT